MEIEMETIDLEKDTEIVGGKSTVTFALHMENRDPKQINPHLQVNFEDVLGEPDTARSHDCVWKSSRRCFNLWKDLCYRTSTFLCGICFAMSWGCQFALVGFLHVWYVTPLLKVLELNCTCAKKIYGIFIGCCLGPLCESVGNVFNACQDSI